MTTTLLGIYRRIFTSRPDWRLDAALLVFIALAGFAVGTHQIQRTGDRDDVRDAVISQALHAPAVMIACDRGFVDVAKGTIPDLDRFLDLEAETFSCESIPADVDVQPPSQWHRYYLYLMYALGSIWSVFGISLSVILGFYGVVFAAALCALYGLMRQVAGPVLALAVLTPIAGSNLWVSIFPLLYYFVKAPFFLATVMLLFMVVWRPPRNSWFPVVALFLGAVIGLSLGFRRDLLAIVPLCIVVILFCSPGSGLRNLPRIAADLTAFVIGLFVAGWPLLAILSEDSNFGHLALQGLSGSLTRTLGISPSFYDWGRADFDGNIAAIVNAYHALIQGGNDYLTTNTKAYDISSLEYFWNVVTTFPADFLLRAIAAFRNVITGAYVFNPGPLVGPILFILFLGLVAAKSLRRAVLCLLIVLYITGYTSFLHRPQDYFHITFVPFLIGSFILQWVLNGVGQFVPALHLEARAPLGADRTLPPNKVQALRALGFPLAAIILALAVIAALRASQGAELEGFIERYWSAPLQNINYTQSSDRNGSVTVTPLPFGCGDRTCSENPSPENDEIRFAYLVARFDRGLCGQDVITPRLMYLPSFDQLRKSDMTREVRISFEGAAEAKVFFPAFSGPGAVLTQISLSADEAPCLAGLHTIREEAMPPIFLFMVLTEDWRRYRRHMVLVEENTPSRGPRTMIVR